MRICSEGQLLENLGIEKFTPKDEGKDGAAKQDDDDADGNDAAGDDNDEKEDKTVSGPATNDITAFLKTYPDLKLETMDAPFADANDWMTKLEADPKAMAALQFKTGCVEYFEDSAVKVAVSGFALAVSTLALI